MRLFVAVELGEALVDRTRQLVEEVRVRAPSARWVSPEKMHVTLVFLGQVEEALLPRVQAAVERVAAAHAPLTLRAGGAGSFGSKKAPRVLWMGLTGDVEALGRIKSSLEEALRPLGHEPEKREFAPHLTLARAREMRGDAALALCREALSEAAVGEARIDRLVLFESKTSPKGARYVKICEPILGGS